MSVSSSSMTAEAGGGMEGWLYVIRSNRIGLQFSRKRYFVLQDHLLKSFKSASNSANEVPLRSAVIDSCIRVMDNGRESIHRKLGAVSSEEAAKWIRSFQEAAMKARSDDRDNGATGPKDSLESFRFSCSSPAHHSGSIDWTRYSSTQINPISSDVIAPSPWTIFGCQNGLRLFKEAKDRDFHGKIWDDHPAIMAVGVVDGTSEAVFRTLMSLGPSRSEWDFCFSRGSVVEHLDGHTDIIHKQLYSDWSPWGMKCRDLLLRRYWRREDDGTYGGGYVISPVNQGNQSLVKHMLAIDWKLWKGYLLPSAARSITIHMLERVAALRELFKAKAGSYPSSEYPSRDLARDAVSAYAERIDIDTEVQIRDDTNDKMEERDMDRAFSEHSSLVGFNDVGDEFFDVSEPSDYDLAEEDWASNYGMNTYSQETRTSKFSTAAGLVRKLHDLAVQKKGYVDLQEMEKEDKPLTCYGAMLPRDPSCNLISSCSEAEPLTFLIRGKTYLEDHQKVKAKNTLMQMVGADWLRSNKREDDLAGRPESIVQKYAGKGGPEFFFIVNIQVPGSTTYSLAFYYMTTTPLENSPLLERFVNGDDAYRNSRFKLIPYISKGSWIVKQSVGKKACLIGQALEINYFRGKNYIELGVDIGSSTVARGVVSLVLGYLSNLVIEMAFLIQANTDEELPEYLLGTCRLNHLDISKAVLVPS
ncbi:ENHANCED DISEASE RESISTANCE 2-like protein [Drosera capensis]